MRGELVEADQSTTEPNGAAVNWARRRDASGVLRSRALKLVYSSPVSRL